MDRSVERRLEDIEAKLDILIRRLAPEVVLPEPRPFPHERPPTARPEDDYVFGSKDERFYRYRP